MGSGEQCDLEPVAGRPPALARQRKPRARLGDRRLPFCTIILPAGRMAIPTELYEARKVDGASSLDPFRHIALPMLASLCLL